MLLKNVEQKNWKFLEHNNLAAVVEQRPQRAASMLACLAPSSARSCPSSMCPGRVSTAWQIILFLFVCFLVIPSSPLVVTIQPESVEWNKSQWQSLLQDSRLDALYQGLYRK